MRSRLRLLLALLALVGQLAVGAAIPATAAPAAVSPWAICSAHAAGGTPTPGTPRHPAMADCALCPGCLLTVQFAIPPLPPVLPGRGTALELAEPSRPAGIGAVCCRGDPTYARGPP